LPGKYFPHFCSAASSSWLVGTVVGHQYGWLRNGTPHAGARKWLPDLRSGWEYRPLVRAPGELTNTWRTDDGTLRIESLRGQAFPVYTVKSRKIIRLKKVNQ